MGSRINRNIVECKYLWQERKYSGRRELIETLWNVNNEDTLSKSRLLLN